PALGSLLLGTSYNIIRFDVPDMHQKLKQICRKQSFDLIQLEGLFVTPYIDTLRGVCATPLLLRQHNVEFRIWEKLAAHMRNPIKKWYLNILAQRLKQYELSCLPKVDYVAAITEDDAADMKHLCPKARILVSPAGIDIPAEQSPGDPFAVYHLGSMEWMPNQEGVRWLLEKVWPLVKEHEPRATLHLAGKGMEADFYQPLPDGVYNDGTVNDAAKWYAGFGISVVPLMAAGGIRMKTLEALAAGKNVVSTSTGAAGLPLKNDKHLLIADDANAFARAILQFMHDDTLRANLRKHGRALASGYDRKLLAAQLLQQCSQ
ncbi:MAG: glycosyltransferase, partial [Bacteroidetes bacterium]|nr:glycosyltransferase [Bacteroidota bacterium]